MGFSRSEKKRQEAAASTNPELGSDNPTALKHKIVFFASQFRIKKDAVKFMGMEYPRFYER